MFRALSALLFIVVMLPLSALAASLIIKVLGVTGLIGFIVGFSVFAGLLTAFVMMLASINDRLNNRDRVQAGPQRTHTTGVR